MSNEEHFIENALCSMEEAIKSDEPYGKAREDWLNHPVTKELQGITNIKPEQVWLMAEYVIFTWDKFKDDDIG